MPRHNKKAVETAPARLLANALRNTELPELLGEPFYRKTNDIKIITFDFLNEKRRQALDSVSAGLPEWLAGLYVGSDLKV